MVGEKKRGNFLASEARKPGSRDKKKRGFPERRNGFGAELEKCTFGASSALHFLPSPIPLTIANLSHYSKFNLIDYRVRIGYMKLQESVKNGN